MPLAAVRAVALMIALGTATAAAQEADVFAPHSTPELGWRETDDAAAFVTRVRSAAARLGGDCGQERQRLADRATGLQVGADQPGAAGKPFELSWTGGGDTGVPAWLVVAVDGPVRFTGRGFYALLPDAIAPFGLPDGAGKTRALVPLFGADALESGSFGIVPLNAGSLEISVSLAGFVRACGEAWSQAVAAGALSVAVSPDPVFSVRDPFSFDAPTQVIASPDQTTSVEIFDGRYRLVDRANGAVLADREGREPRYSPTGRFLVAQRDESLEVLDAVDGTLLASGPSGDVGWENGDSFMIVAQTAFGGVTVRNLPVEKRETEAMLDCTACPGMGTRLTIDLENDLLLRIGGQSYALTRLGAETEERTGMIDVYDEDIMAEAVDAVAGAVSSTGAAPLLVPEHWNFRGGLRFSSLAEDYQPTGDDGFDRWLATMRRGRIEAVSQQTAPPAPSKQLRVSEIGQWRGAAPLALPPVRQDKMPSRLAEFGISTSEPARPVFRKSDVPDEEADPAIAARIEASVPWAKGLFEKKESFGCLPEAASEEKPRIFAYFNDVSGFRIGKRTVWLTLFSCKWTERGAYEPNFYLFDSAAPGLVRLGIPNPDAPNSGRCDSSIAACGFEASLFGDRHLLIWSRPSQAYLLYDLATQKVVTERYGLGRGELLAEMRYSEEDATAVQFNTDDSFFVHDPATAAPLLEGRYVDDEIVAWSPDLRFDATAEGANYVSLRFPGQPGAFTFQQFRQQLRSGGHVRQVIGRKHRLEQAPVQVPPGLAGSITLDGGRLKGALQARDAAELRIYQDGLRTDTLALTADGSIALDVAHAPGARWVSVVAADARGLVSLPLGRDLSQEVATERPVLHALTVGVDRYDAAGLADLGFAVADAGTLSSALSALDGTAMRVASLSSLTDGEASPKAVLAAATRIVEAAREGETVVISFAGHGLMNADGRFYMATSGTDLSAIGRTALAWDDLAAVLLKSRARVVVFLDACHSGAAGTGLLATNDDAAGKLLDGVPSGLLVFSAAKGRQLSEEMGQLGGGVFSNAVADVIARQRPDYDLDGNGAIEVSELYAGVKRRVSELTDGRQVPWLARNEMVGDFALF